MSKEKIETKSQKPRVRFSKSGVPYTRVEDIFESEEGQKIISRMAILRAHNPAPGRANDDHE